MGNFTSVLEILGNVLAAIFRPEGPPAITYQPELKKKNVDQLRSEANQYYEKWKETSRMAKEAYRKGFHAKSHSYSKEAKHLLKLMEDANAEAVEKLKRKTSHSKLNALDLHGFYVQEAMEYLRTVLQEKEFKLKEQNNYHYPLLRIITGKGRHSADGVAKIRPAVIEYLNANDYRYSERPGSVTVDLRPVQPQGKDCTIL